MNDLEQRIAIAEACGWTEIEECTCHNRQLKGFEPNPGQHKKHTPDYLNDLNAMHEAENSAFGGSTLWVEFVHRLCDVTEAVNCEMIDLLVITYRATARQRAEAFLKTLNLWKP